MAAHSSEVVLISPYFFGINEETKASNTFVGADGDTAKAEERAIRDRAMEEHAGLKKALIDSGVIVHSFEGERGAPDAVFCNNWFTVLGGHLFIFPMANKSREVEVREDVINNIVQRHDHLQMVDLRKDYADKPLESTGSIVFDHQHKVAYACLSARTHRDTLDHLCGLIGYESCAFTATHKGMAIYHTNVLMSVGKGWIAVCESCIAEEDRARVMEKISASVKTVIIVTQEQMDNFCGNILELDGHDNKQFVFMSSRSWAAFSDCQKLEFGNCATVVDVPLTTIEIVGGGGVRCCLGNMTL